MEEAASKKGAHLLARSVRHKLFPVFDSDLSSKYKVIGAFLVIVIYSILIISLATALLVQAGVTTFQADFLIDLLNGMGSYSNDATFLLIVAISLVSVAIGWISLMLGCIKFRRDPWQPDDFLGVFQFSYTIVYFFGLIPFFYYFFFFLRISAIPDVSLFVLYGDLPPSSLPCLVASWLPIVPLLLIMWKLLYRMKLYHLLSFVEAFLTLPICFMIAEILLPTGALQNSLQIQDLLWAVPLVYLYNSFLIVPFLYKGIVAYFSTNLVVEARDHGRRSSGRKVGLLLATGALIYVIYSQAYQLIVRFSQYFQPGIPQTFVDTISSLTTFPLVVYTFLGILSSMLGKSTSQRQTEGRLMVYAGSIILLLSGVLIWEPTTASITTSILSALTSTFPNLIYLSSYSIAAALFVLADLTSGIAFIWGFSRMVSNLRRT